MKRIEFLEERNRVVEREMEATKKREEELREENRDLLFSISAGEKLKVMNEGGEALEGMGLVEGEVEGGSVGVVERKGRRRKK